MAKRNFSRIFSKDKKSKVKETKLPKEVNFDSDNEIPSDSFQYIKKEKKREKIIETDSPLFKIAPIQRQTLETASIKKEPRTTKRSFGMGGNITKSYAKTLSINSQERCSPIDEEASLEVRKTRKLRSYLQTRMDNSNSILKTVLEKAICFLCQKPYTELVERGKVYNRAKASREGKSLMITLNYQRKIFDSLSSEKQKWNNIYLLQAKYFKINVNEMPYKPEEVEIQKSVSAWSDNRKERLKGYQNWIQDVKFDVDDLSFVLEASESIADEAKIYTERVFKNILSSFQEKYFFSLNEQKDKPLLIRNTDHDLIDAMRQLAKQGELIMTPRKAQ